MVELLSSGEEEWSKYWDSRHGKFPLSAEQYSSLARSLDDLSAVWAERDGDEIERMKTSLLLTLAQAPEVDPEVAEPRVRELLTATTNPRLYAAAAGAAGPLKSKHLSLRAGLVRGLVAPWGARPVNLNAYSPELAGALATTPREESARALLSLGGLDDATAAYLEGVVEGNAAEGAPALPMLLAEKTGMAADLDFVPAGQRKQVFAIQQEIEEGGRTRDVRQTEGTPAVLLFVYTRCHNPLKCGASATRLGLLQKALKERIPSGKARFLVGSYDPGNDDPEVLMDYLRLRDVVPEGVSLLKSDAATTKELLQRLEALVSYHGNDVSSHSAELFVLDSKNRLACTLRRGHWQVDQAVKVIEGLSGEDSGSSEGDGPEQGLKPARPADPAE